MIHELNDFPYEYTTSDETDKSDKSVPATHYWQNDPNHNVEPKSVVSDILDDLDKTNPWNETGKSDETPKADKPNVRVIPITLGEFLESDNRVNRMKTERKADLLAEKDKRVMRFFIGQQGMIWIVWEIVDIPAGTDDPDYSHLLKENGWGLPTSDGKLAMVTAHPFLTRKQADEFASEGIRYNTQYDDEILTHTYDLGQM